MKTSFPVAEGYEFEVFWTLFGLEIYSVNGEEIHRQRSFEIRAVRQFYVGEGSKQHLVEIKVDGAPDFKSWFTGTDWIAEAYVDGELVVADLTPELRQRSRKTMSVLNFILKFCLLVLAALLCLGMSILILDVLLP